MLWLWYIHVKGHIFAIKENPGFHEHYPREEDKRFTMLSDMRKVWPVIFIRGKRGIIVGTESSKEGESGSDSEGVY
jgi:hypothetical protein